MDNGFFQGDMQMNPYDAQVQQQMMQQQMMQQQYAMQQQQMAQQQYAQQMAQMQIGTPQKHYKVTKSMVKQQFLMDMMRCGVPESNIFILEDTMRDQMRHCCTVARQILMLPKQYYTLPNITQIPYYMCNYCHRGYYCKDDIVVNEF